MALRALLRSFFCVMKLLSSCTMALFLFVSSWAERSSALASFSKSLMSLQSWVDTYAYYAFHDLDLTLGVHCNSAQARALTS